MARVAFIGLGNMGGGMAANLAKAGHDVRAFDLVPEALERAKARGCFPASSADEAVQEEVRNAARSLVSAVRLMREGRYQQPDSDLSAPRPK